jgi:hypothetical protein
MGFPVLGLERDTFNKRAKRGFATIVRFYRVAAWIIAQIQGKLRASA